MHWVRRGFADEQEDNEMHSQHPSQTMATDLGELSRERLVKWLAKYRVKLGKPMR